MMVNHLPYNFVVFGLLLQHTRSIWRSCISAGNSVSFTAHFGVVNPHTEHGESLIIRTHVMAAAIMGDMTHQGTEGLPPLERSWNPLPHAHGRGFWDNANGRALSIADRRWRVRTERILCRAGLSKSEASKVRKTLEEEALTLTSCLEALHGTRSLGNVPDPVEEIVYMILSRRAPIRTAREVLDNLLSTDGGVAGLLQMPREELVSRISRLGIQEVRAGHVIDALSYLDMTYGLDGVRTALEQLPDSDLLAALVTVPGISVKTALCVMLYSFGREVLPVDSHTARFLQRTGLLTALGADLGGLDQKQVQLKVMDALPPSMRGTFHVNAVHHGQRWCTGTRPRCADCPLQLLCATGREALRDHNRATERPTLVDMFCGAGGLSEGFRRAGYRTVLAVDANPWAMRTYRLNHPEVDSGAMLCRDIRGFRDEANEIRCIIGDTQIDVLVGGPPCQGFSRAGLRSKATRDGKRASADERNHLYRELVDLLEVLTPRAVVLENVPGMGEVTYEDGTTFVDAARDAMRAAGYVTTTWLLNAAAYGVPQERVRRIIVGVRGAPAPDQPPPPQHDAPTQQHRVDSTVTGMDLPPPRTLIDALGDLPSLTAGSGVNVCATGDRLLTAHVARPNNPADLNRYAELREGESYRSLVIRRPDLRCYSTDNFADKYYRMPAGRPARTIVAHLEKDGNGFVHPHQTRSITPREAARLQSFDDGYLFSGPLSQVYRQIGNAVPPRLAEAIGRHLLHHLEALREDVTDR